MKLQALAVTTLLSTSLLPGAALALTVNIQGVERVLQGPGDTCIDIAGSYPGVDIQPAEAGRTAKVCYDYLNRNLLNMMDVLLVANGDTGGEVTLTFSHEFSPGPNGRIFGRTTIAGAFATPTGALVPTGDRLSFRGYLLQRGNEDPIGEPLEHEVGNTLESGEFDLKGHKEKDKEQGRKEYLIAGRRGLKAELRVQFTAPGHKLVLPRRVMVSLEAGTRTQEKFEATGEAVPAVPEQETSTPETSPLPPMPPATSSPNLFKGQAPRNQPSYGSGVRQRGLSQRH
jgi:hypothetical protein